jgi:hypothetical protein
VGWQGLPFNGFLNNLSFWTRKNAAARVGRGGVSELLTRLENYRDIRRKQEKETDPHKSQLVITGHSFGGLVIYEALSHALMERAARTKTDDSDGATQYAVAESFGDFVMLVNPAFEGSLYEPLFHIATNRCYDDKQRPVTMIVTSKADSATKTAFPIGRGLSTLLQRARSPEQRDSMRQTIGHNDRYVTHSLTAEEASKEKDPSVLREQLKDKEEVLNEKHCGCPHLDLTSEWDPNNLLAYLEGYLEGNYGTGVRLTAVHGEGGRPTYASNYPYLVVGTNEKIIENHNAIYSGHFTTFAQLFYLRHVVQNYQLPGVKEECRRDEEAYPQRNKGSLLSSEQSCWLKDYKSCSVTLPKQ